MGHPQRTLADGTVVHSAFVEPREPRPVAPEQAARAQHAIAVQMKIHRQLAQSMQGRLRGVVFSKDEAGTEYVRICVVHENDVRAVRAIVPARVENIPIVVLAIGDWPSPTHPPRSMKLIQSADGTFVEN